MIDEEYALRTTAWTWASETLGIESSPDRLDGLIELTSGVRAENLKRALEAAMKSNPSTFLPSVQSVIAAGSRIAAEDREAERQRTDRARRGQFLVGSGDRGSAEHERIMQRLNPEGWSTAQWKRFHERVSAGGAYAREVERLRVKRHEWAAEQASQDIGRRNVSCGVALKIRLEYNAEARVKIPNPCPIAWEGQTDAIV